jgi:hypothetical protein
MSGANHPINYGNSNRIFVTPLEFNSVITTEKARLLIDCSKSFKQGDQIELVEVSVNHRIPTGRTIYRYVQYVESRIPLYLDDDYCAVHLVPARCMIDSLRRS